MNVAFIPVRGGSKSIPLKNIKTIAGKPLVYWAVQAACLCEYIDVVYVATDSEIIRNTVNDFCDKNKASLFSKLRIVTRSKESATDDASTEFAMLEFAELHDFENIVLIQATSPLLTSNALNEGFKKFEEPNVDSVLSVVRQKRFNWICNDKGFVEPQNYDIFHRPRRQDFSGYLVENGAFYITSRNALIKSQNRISGNIKAVEMDEITYWEIDEPSDWEIVEMAFSQNRFNYEKNNYKKIPKIKMFLTDCDGCLTDGGMYYTEYGDEIKKFNTRDGMAFSLLKKKGIITGIITGETSKLVSRRAEKLKLDILEQGCIDKLTVVKELCAKYNMSLKNVLYIGDDINDIELIKSVGISCAPIDAIPPIKKIVKYVSKCKGGTGVIRDAYEEFF